MRKVFFILIPLGLFFSCKPKVDFSRELALTDSLKTDLKKTAGEFYKLDSEKISEAKGVIGAYVEFITVNLKDTISREDANLLSNFKSISQATGKYTRTKKELNSYYRFNLKQIENLEYDLQNGLVNNKDTAMKFLASEQGSNAELITMMKAHLRVIPSQLKMYDSLKPKVEDFIKKINNGTLPPQLVQEAKAKEQETENEEND